MAKSNTRNRQITVAGDLRRTEASTGPDSEILSFADFLDGGKIGGQNGRFSAEHVHVSIDRASDALVLTIHDPLGVKPEPTVVTLAGLGAQYAAYDGLQLSDIIKGLGS